MKAIQRLNAGTWIVIVAAVLMLAATILFQVSIGTSQQYFNTSSNGAIIALDVVGIVLAVVAVVLSMVRTEEGHSKIVAFIIDVLLIGACICVCATVGMMIGSIATEFAYTYLSDFNVGTVKETFMPQALMQAVAAIVIVLVAFIAACVGGWFIKKYQD